MVQITYIEFDGTEHTIEAHTGRSVMENAVKNGVPGIVAECGGSMTCGTCRVQVSPEWLAKMKAPEEGELAVIEYVGDEDPGTRLSCQIETTEELDGLVVRMPERQYN
jgi:2Fe-2S ferredoxin